MAAARRDAGNGVPTQRDRQLRALSAGACSGRADLDLGVIEQPAERVGVEQLRVASGSQAHERHGVGRRRRQQRTRTTGQPRHCGDCGGPHERLGIGEARRAMLDQLGAARACERGQRGRAHRRDRVLERTHEGGLDLAAVYLTQRDRGHLADARRRVAEPVQRDANRRPIAECAQRARVIADQRDLAVEHPAPQDGGLVRAAESGEPRERLAGDLGARIGRRLEQLPTRGGFLGPR